MEKRDNPPFKLMYRGPGRDHHQNITDVLDEILYRLDEIDYKLQKLSRKLTMARTFSKSGDVEIVPHKKKPIKVMVHAPKSVNEVVVLVVNCHAVKVVDPKYFKTE